MSGIEPTAAGTPAPYGRACVNCARAKCRCIYLVAESSCERCHRLQKHCEPSVTVRKRNGRRHIGSRTAQLEEKLEDLVSLLRNQSTVVKQSSVANNVPPTTAMPDPWANTPAPSHGSQTGPRSNDGRNDANPVGLTPTGPQTPGAIFTAFFDPKFFNHQTTPVPMSSMIYFPGMPATQRAAEEHLLLFRERYLDCFPCVYIPPDMTSDELRDAKPFTWFTIMMMSCQNASVQFGMGTTWQKIISQKIVMEYEKSIDLLQGMVIFLGWSQYHKKDKPYLSVFTQLALSQVYGLSLHKLIGDPNVLTCFKPSAFNQNNTVRERTAEDRRTVLACFYITSQIAYTLKKMEGLQWTAHLNDCLTFLTENPEWPGDRNLAAQVRMQLIIDQLGSEGLAGQSAPMPPYYPLSAMTLPIEAVKDQLPPGLEENCMINIQLSYTELVVFENGLCRTPYNPKHLDMRRYDILSRIADTIRSWFNKFFPLSKEYYTALSFAMWCQLAHCLMSLYKLSTLDEPAWDRAALRRDLDLIEICDRIIGDMDEAASFRRPRRSDMAMTPPLYPDSTEADIFSVCTRMVVSMRNSWASELGALQMDPTNPAANKQPVENSFVDNITMGMPMSLLDDAWLTDIFNVSWE